MIKEYSRKKLLKTAGAIACVGLISLMVTACSGKPINHISQHELFKGEVEIIRTETTQRDGLDDYVKAVKLEFNIEKPGSYLFEGWVANLRAQDSLGERWEYRIEKVPHHAERNLKSSVYRLEATRVTDGKTIERDTARFEHHGL